MFCSKIEDNLSLISTFLFFYLYKINKIKLTLIYKNFTLLLIKIVTGKKFVSSEN